MDGCLILGLKEWHIFSCRAEVDVATNVCHLVETDVIVFKVSNPKMRLLPQYLCGTEWNTLMYKQKMSDIAT